MSRIESLTRARIDRSKELVSKVGSAAPLLRASSGCPPFDPGPRRTPVSPPACWAPKSGGASAGQRRPGGWGLPVSGDGWGAVDATRALQLRAASVPGPGRERPWPRWPQIRRHWVFGAPRKKVARCSGKGQSQWEGCLSGWGAARAPRHPLRPGPTGLLSSVPPPRSPLCPRHPADGTGGGGFSASSHGHPSETKVSASSPCKWTFQL